MILLGILCNYECLFTHLLMSYCLFVSLFKSVTVPEFARAGCVASEDVTLSAGE